MLTNNEQRRHDFVVQTVVVRRAAPWTSAAHKQTARSVMTAPLVLP
jgi:hypothetical protein